MSSVDYAIRCACERSEQEARNSLKRHIRMKLYGRKFEEDCPWQFKAGWDACRELVEKALDASD